MYRLANFNEENTEEGSVYRYISVAVSKTIIDCLDEYLDDTEKYDVFFQYTFSDSFFEGLSRYVLPKALCLDEGDDDAQAGYEFTFSKMRRMREKMLDQNEFYTFDVFEEMLLYSMCDIEAARSRTAAGRKKRELFKDKVEAARAELREKFKLNARDANDFSRKMFYASAMLLKNSEDDNLIFWDDDYDFFWKYGFIKGIGYLKSMVGQNAGYGYKYTCDIFSDIGIKLPLMLLGTEEANRIANEEEGKRIREYMDGIYGNITGGKEKN